MGSVGDCFDNAMCESFNATLECELLVTRRFKNQHEAGLAVFDFIEGWYNPHRRTPHRKHLTQYQRRNQAARCAITKPSTKAGQLSLTNHPRSQVPKITGRACLKNHPRPRTIYHKVISCLKCTYRSSRLPSSWKTDGQTFNANYNQAITRKETGSLKVLRPVLSYWILFSF